MFVYSPLYPAYEVIPRFVINTGAHLEDNIISFLKALKLQVIKSDCITVPSGSLAAVNKYMVKRMSFLILAIVHSKIVNCTTVRYCNVFKSVKGDHSYSK